MASIRTPANGAVRRNRARARRRPRIARGKMFPRLERPRTYTLPLNRLFTFSSAKLGMKRSKPHEPFLRSRSGRQKAFTAPLQFRWMQDLVPGFPVDLPVCVSSQPCIRRQSLPPGMTATKIRDITTIIFACEESSRFRIGPDIKSNRRGWVRRSRRSQPGPGLAIRTRVLRAASIVS